MSNPNDPSVSEPNSLPPVPPVPHYGAAPQAPQYAAPQAPPIPPYTAPQAPQYAAPSAPAQYPAAQPYVMTPVRPTNGMAIAALITGILVPLVGIILGHISLGQIKRTGENGRGMALAGLICGYVFTAFAVLYIIFIIVLVVAAGASSTYPY